MTHNEFNEKCFDVEYVKVICAEIVGGDIFRAIVERPNGEKFQINVNLFGRHNDQ